MLLNCLPFLLFLFVSCLGYVAADTDTAPKNNYQHYAITGVHAGVNTMSGARPARRNILDMQKDSVTFDLYIQALIQMQRTPESVLTSWFQIAGIHGRPYTSWDNVHAINGAPLTGYCAHSSVLFPTWHRPYLAMFEQILWSQAQTIAAQYPASVVSKYKAAAANFRIPYWDWATTSGATVPDVINSLTVTINSPTGPQTVSNPLYTYKFQTWPLPNDMYHFPNTTQSGAYDWPLALYRQTVRSPDSQGGPSDIAVANSVLKSAGIQYSTYYALTKSPTYDNFATQAIWGPSIENVHGLIHVDIGGQYGHMSQLSYSAFDPIFFLHHCNVDRIIALYQAMNPINYLTSYYEYYGTYSIAPSSPYGPGTNDTLNSPLPPFSQDTQGTPWTSGSSQYLKTFGYTYPEIQDWNQSPSQLAANVTAQVNMLYSQSTSSKMKRIRSITSDGHEQILEWSVAISVSRFEFNGQRFIVRLFVGEIPNDPKTWATSESCVGNFAVLPPPQQPPTGPMPDVKAYDEVSLVQALMSVGHDGQDVNAVVEYLKDNFEWRVQLMDGTVVAPEQYGSLKVMVQEEVVTLARDVYEIPSYGEKTLHPEITQGKANGYSRKI